MTLPLSLYIHWPFCLSKCPYCDFNSHVMAAHEEEYVGALRREMRFWAEQTEGRSLSSIFFGGGTPSLLSPGAVGTLVQDAARHWSFTPQMETTLEANPTSADAQKFMGFRDAGINRLSLGVQSLDDGTLKKLGRQHTAAEALNALAIAQRVFPRTSFDLIYAHEGQSLLDWEKELQTALTYAQGHVSLYQLTIEPGTVFAREKQGGKEHRAEDEIAGGMYRLTQEITARAGLPAYEVSNHAAPGQECRHNLSYWHYHDYIGIGPGAHGRVRLDGAVIATACLKPPQAWLKAVKEKGAGMEVRTALSLREEQEEHLLMGLRLISGLDHKEWAARYGTALDTFINVEKKSLLIAEKLLVEDKQTLHATHDGLLLLTSLTAALAPD